MSEIELSSGVAGETSWKVAERRVPLELAPYVRGLYGYVERTRGSLVRRELPEPQVVLIFELGPPIRVFESGQTERFRQYSGGFVAGIDDRFTLTEMLETQSGVQLNLTPIGARLLLGLPMSEIRGRVVSMGEALPGGFRFVRRLSESETWPERFDLIEDLLRRRVGSPPQRTQLVDWAFRRVVEGGGRLDVGELSRELGYSHKHLIGMFHDQIGMSPKRLSRLVRFERLTERLKAGRGSWAGLALDLGYSDQAHLTREVRQFSGLTPTELSQLLSRPIASDSQR